MADTPDLVERRRKYIQRQIALDTRAVNVRFHGQAPEGTGPANRHGMPKLPVGRAVWKPRPDFTTAASAWLTAGGAHHTVMSTALGVDVFRDFAELTTTELLVIDEHTNLPSFQKEVRWNQAFHRLAQGL